MTKPHVKICEMLLNRNVEFDVEFPIGSRQIDIWFRNTPIEIMGSYWHCDVRNYTQPKDRKQKESLSKDYKKQTFVENEVGKKILYLWEEDINSNPDLCEKLIFEYIDKGCLPNYHSMNYHMENDCLSINSQILIPHFENQN